MELQQQVQEFEARGVALFAISYDSVEVLAAFAEKRSISYPLLSDQGSAVIRRLGLLNEHLAEYAAYFGGQVNPYQEGIPYPGTFVLDKDGVISDKWFEVHHRYRPSGATTAELLNPDASDVRAVNATVEADGVRVTAWLADSQYRPFQRLRLHVESTLPEGVHVYGPGVSDDYYPLAVTIEPVDGLEVGNLELPDPKPWKMEGLDETFPIYEGTVKGLLPFILTKPMGDVELQVNVELQACTEYVCYPPNKLTLRLPLPGADLIRD